MIKQKSICIFTALFPNVKPWNPDSIQTGVTGSEEAVIYMSQQLAELGYKVDVVFYNGEAHDSPYSHPSANPRFIHVSQIGTIDWFDAAVAWRMPCCGKLLRDVARKVYYWPHDRDNGEIQNEDIDAYDDVLWVSQWQREQAISHSPGYSKFTKVFGNGINEKQFEPIKERSNPYSCIYASNYARGLETLLDLWPSIKEHEPRATLDIYHGWESSGWLTPEPDKEAKMRMQIATLPDVFEHGKVGHEQLNQAYAAASFWCYPCNFWETFCISALRAQLSGAVPVIIEGSALSETVRTGYKCSRPEDYFATLMRAFQDAEKITLEDRRKMGEFVLKEFTWREVACKWKNLFEANG